MRGCFCAVALNPAGAFAAAAPCSLAASLRMAAQAASGPAVMRETLSVSLFSCRLFPFSNKMNPVIKQRSTFLKPILHHFSSFFSEGSRMSKKPGKQSSLHVLLCFSQVSFPSNNSLGTILSLHLPHLPLLVPSFVLFLPSTGPAPHPKLLFAQLVT